MNAASGLIAITHVPSPNMQLGERTFAGDDVVDNALAARQHEAYREALRACGATVVVLDVYRSLPDCVFVEDTALVLDELAVMMSPGAESRRGEATAMEPALREYRSIERVVLPATIDGGDIVRAGRDLYVGVSPRTSMAGVESLRTIVRRYVYTVTAVSVTGCLHLKTACSALPDGRFLVNENWIDVAPLLSAKLLQVPEAEQWSGDVLTISDRIIASDAFPETLRLLESAASKVLPVSVSEYAKVEGGVTCLSLVFSR